MPPPQLSLGRVIRKILIVTIMVLNSRKIAESVTTIPGLPVAPLAALSTVPALKPQEFLTC